MRVYNKKKDKSIPADAVYVGRPSKFGNPFTHIKNQKTLAKFIVASRDEAVAAFEDYLNDNPELIKAVKTELKGKSLVCYCAPQKCHADILLRVANEE